MPGAYGQVSKFLTPDAAAPCAASNYRQPYHEKSLQINELHDALVDWHGYCLS